MDGDFAPDSFSDPMEFGRSMEGPNDAFLALVKNKENSQLFGFNFGAGFFIQRGGPNDVLEGRRRKGKLRTEVFKALDAVRCFACLHRQSVWVEGEV